MVNIVAVDLAELLDRSNTFDVALRTVLIGEENDGKIPGSARSNGAFSCCKIALAHGEGFRHLVAIGNATSAVALVRLQFEAVLRCSWLYFVASDDWIDTFTTQPTANGDVELTKYPFVNVMLEELAASTAEAVLPVSLSKLKELAWDSLNSYTHGGLRAMVRALEGFKPELLIWMLRTTNSLTYISVQLIAQIANDIERSERLFAIHESMLDCLHSSP
jgi:hypothetical protein